MATSPTAALFDVDGVLLDSLPAHLAVCRDKSREFGLELAIPDVNQFRALVRQGTPISPMSQFFLAVGFPADLAELADRDYRATFAAKYSTPVFPGVARMLSRLADAGVALGLVTSNGLSNVRTALGDLMGHFGEAVFTRDDVEVYSKSAALTRAVAVLGIDAEHAWYVGDQLADASAAREAGLQFLGVSYGWGIVAGDHGFYTVDRPAQIADYLLREGRRSSELRP